MSGGCTFVTFVTFVVFVVFVVSSNLLSSSSRKIDALLEKWIRQY